MNHESLSAATRSSFAESFLKSLVAIPSLSKQEHEAVGWLVSQMDALGYDQAFIDDAGNAVGILEPPVIGPDTETVMLLGHIDTVPGDVPVSVRDGKLFGRGSVDAKGSLATFVLAAAAAQRPPSRRIVVVGAVEEEATSSKGARFIASHYRPDWCVIGEPSGSQAVTLGYKGRWHVRGTIERPAAHSAGPLATTTEVLFDRWQQMVALRGDLNYEVTSLFRQTQIALDSVNSGSDGMRQWTEFRIGLRLPPNFDADSFSVRAASILEGAPGSEFTCRIRFEGYETAHQEPRSSSLVQRFNRAFREQHRQPRHKLKTGTSDMNVVAPVWNCPIVAYGPGDSSLDHTPHEHLPWEELHAAIKLLTAVLESE